eukprot:SAG11_NODE_55_length_19449_cov_28.630135_15_plen_75_part_00
MSQGGQTYPFSTCAHARLQYKLPVDDMPVLCTPKNTAGYYYQFGTEIQISSSNNPKTLNAVQNYTELGWLYGVV